MSSSAPALNGRTHRSSATVVATMVSRLASVVDDPSLAASLETMAAVIDGETNPTNDSTESAIGRLATSFKLSPFERDLLVLIGLPEEHYSLTMSVRRINPLGEPWFGAGVLADVLGLDHGGRLYLRQALDSGNLRRHGLLTVNETQPFPEAVVRLADGLWSAIRGGRRWPTGLQPKEIRSQPIGKRTDNAIQRLQAACRPDAGPSIVLVSGGARPTSDLAAGVAAAIGGTNSNTTSPSNPPVAFFTSDQLGPEQDLLISAHAVARQCVPVVLGRPPHNPLTKHPGPVIVCLDDSNGLELDDRPLIAVDLGPKTMADDVDMWRRLLPDLGTGQEATTLAGLLRVDSVTAGRAVGDAQATARLDNTDVTSTMVIDQVRRRSTSTLPASVHLVRPTADWERLVTTGRNQDLLTSIINRVENQAQVLLDWQFGNLPGRRGSRGVRALFAGPPGTGKTMSAEILAGVLGLDLLVVDLSALVSKWLGETEKNISEVFAAADRSQSVLFFDEADSVFARRTDGSDAQGRWANLETAHLLTRMEQYDGLIILASNLRGNIDDAFIRRLDVIVEFEEPGMEERQRLWTNHLPSVAPWSDDVDLAQLAELYQVTGGLIRNAALDAAFRAAATNQPITQLGLVMAVAREFDKAGKTFPGIPRYLRDSGPTADTPPTTNPNLGDSRRQEGA